MWTQKGPVSHSGENLAVSHI
jgi:hypothetical protein